MKLFLDINAKKIETVISYFDNYLWKVGIQNFFLFSHIYVVKKFVIDLANCVNYFFVLT